MSGDDTLRDATRTKLGVGEPSGRDSSGDLTGKVVAGRYVIEAKLGSGAFGVVYRGVHTKLGRTVAIKVLHPHLVHEPTILARFRREARAAARLQHPNLAAVLDVGETLDGRELIVLEFAEGQRLSELMDAPMPAPRVVALLQQLLRGLDHAHDAGLIHRDLKPDNIIVEQRADGTEVPRIVDFGIATLRDPDETMEGGRLTASGQMIGTPLYMSPEQARLDPYDHRADLFALGVIAYELLAGTIPFDGSAIEVALANMNRDPPSIGSRAGIEVEPLLEAFVRKLMARQADDRFASAHAALQVLELVERAPAEAGPLLGIIDVAKAMAVVALPPPPVRKR